MCTKPHSNDDVACCYSMRSLNNLEYIPRWLHGWIREMCDDILVLMARVTSCVRLHTILLFLSYIHAYGDMRPAATAALHAMQGFNYHGCRGERRELSRCCVTYIVSASPLLPPRLPFPLPAFSGLSTSCSKPKGCHAMHPHEIRLAPTWRPPSTAYNVWPSQTIHKSLVSMMEPPCS